MSQKKPRKKGKGLMKFAICYYTSNRENPEFEKKIQDNILSITDLPIISVSQKPIDFGKNICVGDVGVSGFNCFRQIQIALKNTDADFVISAEADCLYPPDYFKKDTFAINKCFRMNNLYVMGDHRSYYWRKLEGATHAQVIYRKFYLDRLNKLFEGAPKWSTEEFNFPKERHKQADVFDESEIRRYFLPYPVVQIKTHNGMRYHTHSERINIYDIPYWGNGKKLRKRICG